ncbi:MAG TPA: ribose-phosphate diphosphokinase [Thermoanaerobaculia bacterium]|nr:ribose-phosphate diphosphokinase [Thermoanaerobaculia bacterium]
MTRSLVFAIDGYDYLADDLVATTNAERGAVARDRFPDGERHLQFETNVAHRDVVLVGGTISDAATLEVYDLASTAIENGAHTLTLIIPWFGYATMERATHPGEVVAAKTRARLLSSIPQAGSGNRVVLFDLHSEGIPYYFEGGLRPFHVYGKELVFEATRRLVPSHHFVLASTDAGRAKWVESLANDLGVPAAFIIKRRVDAENTEVRGVSAKVQGKPVIIYDDMIRTGSSLLHAADAYRRAGATEVSAVASHGVFPGDALETIMSSGLIDRIVCTDSHPRARAMRHERLEVVPVAPMFVAFVR